MKFSEAQIQRYSRQILLPDVGGVGQRRLLRATVIAQVGDAATDAALVYLVAAGIGRVGLLSDGGNVKEPHISASILLGPQDLGRPYMEVVAERLQLHNPELQLVEGTADSSASLSIAPQTRTCAQAISTGCIAATELLIGLLR